MRGHARWRLVAPYSEMLSHGVICRGSHARSPAPEDRSRGRAAGHRRRGCGGRDRGTWRRRVWHRRRYLPGAFRLRVRVGRRRFRARIAVRGRHRIPACAGTVRGRHRDLLEPVAGTAQRGGMPCVERLARPASGAACAARRPTGAPWRQPEHGTGAASPGRPRPGRRRGARPWHGACMATMRVAMASSVSAAVLGSEVQSSAKIALALGARVSGWAVGTSIVISAPVREELYILSSSVVRSFGAHTARRTQGRRHRETNRLRPESYLNSMIQPEGSCPPPPGSGDRPASPNRRSISSNSRRPVSASFVVLAISASSLAKSTMSATARFSYQSR